MIFPNKRYCLNFFQWFYSIDGEGRVYYFEENSTESSWTLPDVDTSAFNEVRIYVTYCTTHSVHMVQYRMFRINLPFLITVMSQLIRLTCMMVSIVNKSEGAETCYFSNFIFTQICHSLWKFTEKNGLWWKFVVYSKTQYILSSVCGIIFKSEGQVVRKIWDDKYNSTYMTKNL